MKIELSKPFEFEVVGKKVRHTVLEIPLEEMTGSDMIAVENQLQGEGKFTMLGDFSKQFQIRLASRALKIPVQILERLPLRDFNKVVTAVQGFFAGLGIWEPGGGAGRKDRDSPGKSLKRIALRLARAETATPVNAWLDLPVASLPEWCGVVLEESKKRK